MKENNEMSRLRLAFFPVTNAELHQFFSMCAMIFCTIFSYGLLRAYKDALILSAPGSGAEVLPFLKIYIVFPMTVLVTLSYMKLRKSFGMSLVYPMIISSFLLLFVLYALVLFPLRDLVHPSADWTQMMQHTYPPMRYFFAIIGRWADALFYVTAELWGTFSLNVLFWQFANETTTASQSKRLYPLYVMSGNMALLALFPVLQHVSKNQYNDLFEVCGIVLFCGLCMLFFFRSAVSADSSRAMVRTDQSRPVKQKLSMGDSLAVLFRSRYIGYIAVLVFAYGFLISVVELIWKSQLQVAYTSRQDLLRFISYYNLFAGVVTIIMNYVSKGVIRRTSWMVGAIITPVFSGVLSVVFFVFVLNMNFISALSTSFQVLPLSLTVWFGSCSVMLMKGTKYSFFDPTKEMAFIPLDVDLKVNGKAAVDGIGGRLGKSAGGFVASVLLMLCSTAETAATAMDIAPFLFVMVLMVILFWAVSVLRLNVLYSVAVGSTADKCDTSVEVPV